MRKTEKKKFKKEEGKFKRLDNHARDRQMLLESNEPGRKKRKPRTNRDYGEEGVKTAEQTTERLRDALTTVRRADGVRSPIPLDLRAVRVVLLSSGNLT